MKKEIKTRCCSVALTQTDYENIKKILSIKQLQFSSVAGDLLKKYIKDNQNLVTMWDNMMKQNNK